MQTKIAIHKTFDDEGEPLYQVATQEGVEALNDAKLGKLLSKYEPSTTTIRITNISSAFKLVEDLKKQGYLVVSCHWHATGVAKNLEAAEIAQAFYRLSDEIFTEVKLRWDIFELKQMIAARSSIVDYRKAAGLKLGAVARTMGLGDDPASWPLYLQSSQGDLEDQQKEKEGPVEKAINRTASAIPECQLLNRILGISNTRWMTSASIVAYLGDIERFATVSSLWHYAGQHVVDGKAPKRSKGQAQTWNPKLRTVLWTWCDSMLKTKNPIWRSVYDAYREAELAVHEQKCAKCAAMKCGTEAQKLKKTQTISSHSGARARRRVTKDVLKQYWIETRGGIAMKAAA